MANCATRDLQKIAMKCGFSEPRYLDVVIPPKGCKQFKVKVLVGGIKVASGYGRNKKEARKNGATKALPVMRDLLQQAPKQMRAELLQCRKRMDELERQQQQHE